LRHASAFFFDVEALQADEGIPRFHYIKTPKRSLILLSFDNRETNSLWRIKVAASLPKPARGRLDGRWGD
jgi:hypothetical protein